MQDKIHPLVIQKLREFIDDDEEIDRIVNEFECKGYARLSREDDKTKDKTIESSSITRQKDTFTGYSILPEFVDDGKSGALDEEDEEEIKIDMKGTKILVALDLKKRPNFIILLESMKKGKVIFCATNWDRWGRSVVTQELTRIYARQHDCYVIALHDSNQPEMRMMSGIFNEAYIRLQRKKMDDSAKTKFKHGLYNGRAKLNGYTWGKGYKEYQTLFPSNDAETELIKKLFVMAESKDINTIRLELKLDYGFVKNNLTNIYHAGFIKHHKKDLYKRGIHPAIIELDKFLAVQRRLGNDVVADKLSKV